MKITIEEAEALIVKLKWQLRDLALNYVQDRDYDCRDWYVKTIHLTVEIDKVQKRICEIEKYIDEAKD